MSKRIPYIGAFLTLAVICSVLLTGCSKSLQSQSASRTELVMSTVVTITSVSYTHLDVYKRQLFTIVKHNRKEEKRQEKKEAERPPFYNIGAKIRKTERPKRCLLYTSRCV